MKKLIGLLAFTFTLLLFSNPVHAQQPPPGAVVRINPIEISGLGNNVGRFLTVIYARGSRATIATSASQISVWEINRDQKVLIESDTVKVKEMDLQRSGLWIHYNLIIFVIHRDEKFVWKNYTPGEFNPTTSGDTIVDSMTKQEFEQLRKVQLGLETAPTGQEVIRYKMKLTP